MTDNKHPITPPPELVQKWLSEHFKTTITASEFFPRVTKDNGIELCLATQAARWGYDQAINELSHPADVLNNIADELKM